MDDWPAYSWTPDAGSGITQRFVDANGQRFELAECGPANADRLALCLHGFPELNFSWRAQMPMLAARGWRVWAPNMRGYGASSKPAGVGAYGLNILAQDVACLIDAAQEQAGKPLEIMLIAHDWGALVAWHFAICALRPLAKLVIMNVPHPKCAERELRHWYQLKKSWYIFLFQLPRLPEWMLTRRGAAAIKRIFINDALNKQHFPPDVQQIYANAALRPGAMHAMINYYRALLRAPDRGQIGDAMVRVPTLMIWGENDVAIDVRCTDGTGQWVPDLELHRLPGISHWVQQDAPDDVNARLADWLDRRGG
ncbi:MAG: alpha/beta fold hydrolase [Sphingopyxis sp.]